MPEDISKTFSLDTLLKVAGIIAGIALAWGSIQTNMSHMWAAIATERSRGDKLEGRVQEQEIALAQLKAMEKTVNRIDDRLLRMEKMLKE